MLGRPEVSRGQGDGCFHVKLGAELCPRIKRCQWRLGEGADGAQK